MSADKYCSIDLKYQRKYMNFVSEFKNANERAITIVQKHDLLSLFNEEIQLEEVRKSVAAQSPAPRPHRILK